MNEDNHSQAQTKVLLSKTSQSPVNAQSPWRNMELPETLVFLEYSANSFAQTGTSSYVGGKEVGVEVCKWKGGERKEGRRWEKKKKDHSQSPQILHLSLHSPLPSPRTTYFLTVLARAMVLTHVQSSVHKFKQFFFHNLSPNSYRLPLISQALFPEHIFKIHTFLVARE